MKLNNFTILTDRSVLDIPYENDEQYTRECTRLVEEQDTILKTNGFGLDKRYRIHLLDSRYRDETYIDEEINEAVQYLSIKDGVDLVRFDNGNYGFVAYYNGTENGFEILNESEE